MRRAHRCGCVAALWHSIHPAFVLTWCFPLGSFSKTCALFSVYTAYALASPSHPSFCPYWCTMKQINVFDMRRATVCHVVVDPASSPISVKDVVCTYLSYPGPSLRLLLVCPAVSIRLL